MHPEQARQSANVMEALASFFWLPSTSSSLYDPSTAIFILAPEMKIIYLSIYNKNGEKMQKE